ncbi:hypothetical protein N7530_006801 [Penicillium desertorum]|uniref:Uncharacterized protein n=1 Tax=Penicillium desertorum TaxID=1303715 RepID=A0A9W9WSE8_9EURO|nr:hypothetical protein N7530_006801 [Penicillium desertorum]
MQLGPTITSTVETSLPPQEVGHPYSSNTHMVHVLPACCEPELEGAALQYPYALQSGMCFRHRQLGSPMLTARSITMFENQYVLGVNSVLARLLLMLMSLVSQTVRMATVSSYLLSWRGPSTSGSPAAVNTVSVWMRMIQISEWQAKLVLKVQAGFEVTEPEPMEILDSQYHS